MLDNVFNATQATLLIETESRRHSAALKMMHNEVAGRSQRCMSRHIQLMPRLTLQAAYFNFEWEEQWIYSYCITNYISICLSSCNRNIHLGKEISRFKRGAGGFLYLYWTRQTETHAECACQGLGGPSPQRERRCDHRSKVTMARHRQ